ncbi:MAG: SUMF1/EgtB/PvdO family nonheme iron enzyme [Alphaproteobacteria bacterium]|nr:SUMF1/EgtB/PvdO family nonheme iron enzyme [Alphaproteobacteria bacterium]
MKHTSGTFAFDDETGEAPVPSEERYRELGPLGEGAMGEVVRVHDTWLDRHVALKRLRPALTASTALVARFVAEARTTAQLTHPAILPVLDWGTLDDGRMYYTMPVVQGRTLGAAIAASDGDLASTRRLLEAVLTAARAVGHAHERGVVHRDLKPENIMLTAEGAVYLVDWGIARVLEALGGPDAVRATPGAPARRDEIVGTPRYMAPEQARGEGDRVGPATDVYALGRILREVIGGPPVAYGLDGLESLAEAAMAPRPEDRPPSGHAFADVLERWLSGHTQRLRAEALVEDAKAAFQRSRDRFADGRRDLFAARDALDTLIDTASMEAREAAWALEDAGTAAMRESVAAIDAGMFDLHTAVELAPDLVEAQLLLAHGYAALHQQNEARTLESAPHLLQRLRHHVDRLPVEHPDRTWLADYADGRGTFSLETDPPGAKVVARPVETVLRGRMVEGSPVELGSTPLGPVVLPSGSWILTVSHPACETTRLPVKIPRSGAWTDARIDGAPLGPLRLPRTGELAEDDVFVPRGRFYAGHEELIGGGFVMWMLWAADFVIKRDPVTVGEYLEFLRWLDAAGRSDEADRHTPDGGAVRRVDGRFGSFEDEDGDAWPLDWPILWIGIDSAKAYADWYAAKTGLPWRLPGVLEWEKAARGADGRPYPWGLRREDTFSRLVGSPVRGPARISEVPLDVSPYGVRGLGGNAQDWCDGVGDVHCGTMSMLARWRPNAGKAIARGNGWSTAVYPVSRVLSRRGTNQCIGFRLARSTG